MAALGAVACVLALPRWVRAASAPAGCDDLSAAQQYWLALNEGRDLTPFAPIARAALTPENRTGQDDEFNRRRTEVLARIRVSAPLPEVKGAGPAHAGVPGADWPSLGGNRGHTGVTTEPGPTQGEVQWRFPVGFDYRAGPYLAGDTVYAVSPGTETVLYALDRATGAVRWTSRRPMLSTGLAPRATGPITVLSNGELCVPEMKGRRPSIAFSRIDPRTGRIDARVPAVATEPRFSAPEPTPQLRHAYIGASGTEIDVKALSSGRMWWTFPTGPVRAEPITYDGRIYAATTEGVLWALNMDGAERVAWSTPAGAPVAAPLAVTADAVYGAAEDGSIQAWDTRSGARRWRTAVAAANPRARQLFSAPDISEGRVLVGAADGALYCLDAATGKLRWKFSAGDWIRARPFARGHLVVVATLSGDVLALSDAGNHAALRWTRHVAEHPVLGDLAGDAAGVFVADNALWLHALNPETGAVEWERRLIPSCGDSGVNVIADAPPQIRQSPPTVHAGVVYAGGPDRFLHAVDARTGRALWRYELGGYLAGAPTIAGNLVIVGEYWGTRLSALNPQSGEPVWVQKFGSVWASPEYDGHNLYVGTTDGRMCQLDPRDGTVKWSWQCGRDIYTAPAVDDTAVYFGSWDGYYYALEKKTGAVKWAWSPPGYTYQFGGRPDSAAAVLDQNKLVVPINGAHVVALDKATGRLIWNWQTPAGLLSNITAVAAADAIVISTFGDTYVQPFGVACYALDPATGKPRWELPGFGGLSSPVLTGAGLLVGGSLMNPYIEAYRFDPQRVPQLVWRLRTQGNMDETLPAVSGDLAFFLSNDGWLRAIR